MRPAEEIVRRAEALLARGEAVVVPTEDWPVLGRALGDRGGGGQFVALRPDPPARAERLALRLRDITAAGVGLALASPLLGVLALLIKRSSPGPVFFATEVVGRDGRLFVWRKLRSMRSGTAADEERRREQFRAFVAGQDGGGGETATRKIVDESRVTGVGRFMRRHSLDELPQLWNVLRGEMTLVGPRPCLPYEYELQPEWQRRRYRVTPGLSGPWQAYGRSSVSADAMALMDFCYGYRRSFWLDLRIILRTVRVVLTGEGGR